MRHVKSGIHSLKRTITLALLLFALAAASIRCGVETAQIDPLPTSTGDPSPKAHLTATSTPTATASVTPTATLTPTTTASNTPTVTLTPTALPSVTPTGPATPTPTLEPDATATLPNTALTDTAPTARIPILMYHHVAIAPEGADAIRVDLSVPPDVFNREIKFLHDQGFHTIHLTDAMNNLLNGAPLPPKPIVITFDDGYDDNYMNAFPTLKDFGFVGTFFIISNRADSSAAGYMTWPQIQEMAANGMEIGSHSLDHRYNLGQMPASVQWAEIKPSHDAIVQHLPNQAPVFAYPSGSYNLTTIGFLRQLGYVAAVTTLQGVTQYADAPLELRRVRIRGEWSINEFAFWLSYWLGGL